LEPTPPFPRFEAIEGGADDFLCSGTGSLYLRRTAMPNDAHALGGAGTPCVREDFDRDLVAILPRLRRYALGLCRSTAAADDLVQGACLKALAKAASWHPGTRFDAWMFRILRNHWIDGVRRNSVEGEFADSAASADALAPPTEGQLLDRLMLEQVKDAIAQLPSEQREVILLVCVDDLSYREVADVLNIPIGTVMSRLARARRRLLDKTQSTIE
jgi:RNA polymerase sigma-70 factor, ECF subfamily